MRLQQIVILLATIALTSCMVGPNFHTPNAPKTTQYTKSPLPQKTASIPSMGNAGKAQQFVIGANIPLEWWTLYHSPALNKLITQGLANSPDLASAQAALEQARQTLYAQIGTSLLPSANAQLNGQRQEFSDATIGAGTGSPIFNLFNATVNVSYTLDLFGGARREIESLRAEVDYNQYLLEASYLTLTSNIVTAAITEASLKAQIQATRALVQSQEDQLTIVKRQFQVGGVSGADVLSQESQLAQTRATLPPLEQSLSQTHLF